LKIVTDTLDTTQKRYNKGRLKEERLLAEKNKKNRFFKEAGLSLPEMAESGDKGNGVKSANPVSQYFSRLFSTYQKRQEYLKKQKTLRNIEQLLVKTGSISKVESIDAEGEIISIMESGLTKNISDFKIDGYEFFGKILGKDKIVGDTFGHFRDGMKTIFYFGDATGHGIQAGFTVSQLTKIFYEQIKKRLQFSDLYVLLNNELKSKLKGRVFVTGVFLEHDAISGRIRFIGAGHDPMYVYRAHTQTVEKIIPGGLAMGVRNIINSTSIKVRDMPLEDGDFLMGYTDGIIEARNSKGELYGLERLEKAIKEAGKISDGSISRIFQEIFQNVREFMGNEIFLDDVSVFIFKRNFELDILSNKADIDDMIRDFDLSKRTISLDLKGRTRAEVQKELQKERQLAELKARLVNMESLYKLGEYGKLKQEVTLCYKNGFVDPKMNFYLEKILKNEDKVKVIRQEDRLQKEYDKLKGLFDKGEYSIVLRDAVDILYKNGNI
jgi:serine phosphatase RsbU (regulator of sigma subunit)